MRCTFRLGSEGVVTRAGLVHGIGVTLVLGAASAAAARPAAPRQAQEDEAAPAACTLPDLSRMHEATRTQLGDAYRALEVLEPRSGAGASAEAADPRRGDAHGALGMLLLAADYPGAAGRCLRNATRLAPGEFRWPYYLGHVHIRLGDLDRAVESLERALTIEPDDLAALVWLVHVQIDLDQPAEAERLLARAWASHPGTPRPPVSGGESVPGGAGLRGGGRASRGGPAAEPGRDGDSLSPRDGLSGPRRPRSGSGPISTAAAPATTAAGRRAGCCPIP